MTKFKTLNWMQIGGLLREKAQKTEFEYNSNQEQKFDQLEELSYIISINIDVDSAYDAIERGLDLTDCLAESQVEFCA